MLQPNSIRRLKISSVSPSKCTVNPSDKTKPKNKKTQFEFSQPVVVQPVTAYVLEVDSPQQYSDIEKDPECSEIYCVDEVPVDYLPSQDVCKQLFTDTDSEVFSHQKEVDDGSKDDGLFGNPLENSETNVNNKCSGLLEEISSDLAEKHRYSPNYVLPLKAVQSNDYDNDEILDYTGSPRHCVAVNRGIESDSKWQDDLHLDSHKFHVQHSPDPWAVKRQTQNTSTSYTKTSMFKSPFSHLNFIHMITTSKAGSTTCDDHSTTSTTDSSVIVSAAKYSTAYPVSSSVTTTASNSDSYSATLSSAYRRKSYSIYQFTNSSIPAMTGGPYIPSEPSFYTLRNYRRTVKTSHIDTKPFSVSVTTSTVTTRPKLSSTKTSSMAKFYKEMVPLSRKTLNNSENVKTKIQQFEGITSQSQKEKDNCNTYGLTGISSEVRQLDNSPQQHHGSKVIQSGMWNFHSPAPMQKEPPVERREKTRKSNVHTQYTFQYPKVKSEVTGELMGDQCYQHHKILTNKNVAGDDREGTTGGIVGRKRSSPSSQTDTYKHSRPVLHYTNNSDQTTHTSSSTTLQHKVIPILLPPKGKENNNPQATDKQDEGINNNKQDNNTSVYHINQFPTTQTILLREWII